MGDLPDPPEDCAFGNAAKNDLQHMRSLLRGIKKDLTKLRKDLHQNGYVDELEAVKEKVQEGMDSAALKEKQEREAQEKALLRRHKWKILAATGALMIITNLDSIIGALATLFN